MLLSLPALCISLSSLLAVSAWGPDGEYMIWTSMPTNTRAKWTYGGTKHDQWGGGQTVQWAWDKEDFEGKADDRTFWLQQPFDWHIYDEDTMDIGQDKQVDANIVWKVNCNFEISTMLKPEDTKRYSVTMKLEEPYCKPTYEFLSRNEMAMNAHITCPTVKPCEHEKCKGKQAPTWDQKYLQDYADSKQGQTD